MGDRLAVIRTVDLGADKQARYLDIAAEANQLGFVQSDVMSYAYSGTNLFTEAVEGFYLFPSFVNGESSFNNYRTSASLSKREGGKKSCRSCAYYNRRNFQFRLWNREGEIFCFAKLLSHFKKSCFPFRAKTYTNGHFIPYITFIGKKKRFFEYFHIGKLFFSDRRCFAQGVFYILGRIIQRKYYFRFYHSSKFLLLFSLLFYH
jgi:hypothetical protein